MFNILQRWVINRFIILSAFIFIGACSTTPSLTKEELSASTALENSVTDAAYKIGVDDTVQVNVWRNPELSVVVPVRPDGKISMPLIGDVQAGGFTPEQVANEIKRKLSTYIRDPQVAVILTALRSHEFLTRVRVTGAVRTPTSLPHRQGMTVLDAILSSGGLNEFAAPGRARLYRNLNGQTKSINVDLDDIINKGKLEQNYVLQPGDVITVPERVF